MTASHFSPAGTTARYRSRDEAIEEDAALSLASERGKGEKKKKEKEKHPTTLLRTSAVKTDFALSSHANFVTYDPSGGCNVRERRIYD